MATTSDVRQRACELMRATQTGALGTVGRDGTPHVATVYCTVHDDLSLYFMTRIEARKYANLCHQPKVALAFSDQERLQTIQLTGTAERVEDFKLERSIWHELILLRQPKRTQRPSPAIQLFESGGTNEIAIIKVTPTEMTFANFEEQPDGRYKSFFRKVL